MFYLVLEQDPWQKQRLRFSLRHRIDWWDNFKNFEGGKYRRKKTILV